MMVLMDCSLLLSIILGPATGPVNSPSAAVPRLREHPVLNGLIHFDPVGTPKHSVLNSFSFSQGSCLSELTAVQWAWQKLQEPWRRRGRMGKKVAHQRYLCFPIRGKQNNIKQPTSACYKKKTTNDSCRHYKTNSQTWMPAKVKRLPATSCGWKPSGRIPGLPEILALDQLQSPHPPQSSRPSSNGKTRNDCLAEYFVSFLFVPGCGYRQLYLQLIIRIYQG